MLKKVMFGLLSSFALFASQAQANTPPPVESCPATFEMQNFEMKDMLQSRDGWFAYKTGTFSTEQQWTAGIFAGEESLNKKESFKKIKKNVASLKLTSGPVYEPNFFRSWVCYYDGNNEIYAIAIAGVDNLMKVKSFKK